MTSQRSKRVSRASQISQDRPLGNVQPNRQAWSRHTLLLAATTFLSAFLLFQIQPLLGKTILPGFGGSPAVWSTALCFFQLMLLAGYCYVHLSTICLTPTVQILLHMGLLAFAVVCLPIGANAEWSATGDADPTYQILGLLGRIVGVPFFVLSTTAPLAQVWWFRTTHQSPYRLYAVSNAGSLLALLSYPFIVEPNLGISWQAVVWSVGFVVFAFLLTGCAVIIWRGSKGRTAGGATVVRGPRPTWSRFGAWLGLSCCGSVLLLAMTNHLSQNVAVVPFLWVAPLALYLLSFILTFGSRRLYRRDIFGGMMIVTLVGCAYLYDFDVVYDLFPLLAVHLAGLFAGCMVCHGELINLKPDTQQLTAFYLAISAGGALGGLFVSLAAPVLFAQHYEYPLVLVACWLVLLVIALGDQNWLLYRGRPLWAWGAILLAFALFLMHLRDGIIKDAIAAYMTRRNFYGVISVQRAPSDVPPYAWAELRHGIIRHGAQYLDEAKQHEPTSYYASTGGLGYAMLSLRGKTDKRVGVLGLGIGTVAAYCERGDYFRFYEIDPDVIDIATDPRLFTFWTLFAARGAQADIVPGDARICLTRELESGQRNHFDLLVLDVFTGDAIPVHLLTREAFHIYFQHLIPDGVLAVHISNRHLNLLPIVQGMAAHFGTGIAEAKDRDVSHWALLAPEPVLERLAAKSAGKVRLLRETRDTVMWTDDYSNIFSVLK